MANSLKFQKNKQNTEERRKWPRAYIDKKGGKREKDNSINFRKKAKNAVKSNKRQDPKLRKSGNTPTNIANQTETQLSGVVQKADMMEIYLAPLRV